MRSIDIENQMLWHTRNYGSWQIFRVLNVKVFHCLGVTPVLVDNSVDKISPLETDVNDWELFFMRCCIPLALSMNNRGLTGTHISLCFLRTSEKVRTQKLISGNVYIEAIRSRSTNLSLRTKERGQVETDWLHT